MKEFITNQARETEDLAPQILQLLADKQVVALVGNLGAGKTVLVKALAQHLGIKENLTSPTFVLLKVYPVSHKRFDKLIHVDCYRLDKAEDLSDIGLEDYLNDPRALLLIEWADKIKRLPSEILTVKIELLGGQQRKITII